MKPNILWICTDQQRFDSIGCYGNEHIQTPNLDRLAANGLLFEHAYCRNPICSPSRASFMIGRYPRTTLCRQNGQDISAGEKLVSKIFSEAEYTVGLAGKLHFSAVQPSKIKTAEPRIDDGYDLFYWSHGRPHQSPANQYHIWLTENGQEYGATPISETKYVEMGMPKAFHQTKWCTDRAIDEVPAPNYVEGELDSKPACHERERHESDHGKLLGDHGIFCKGPFFYEPSVRVPLIISCALVELVDIAPTVLEAAGLEMPTAMQGRSFWSRLSGEVPVEEDQRPNVYCE